MYEEQKLFAPKILCPICEIGPSRSESDSIECPVCGWIYEEGEHGADLRGRLLSRLEGQKLESYLEQLLKNNFEGNHPLQRAAWFQIRSVCNLMLTGYIPLLLGARLLGRFSTRINKHLGLPLDPFVGISSQTDHLPLGIERKNWDGAALLEKEAEAEAYLCRQREWILDSCRSVLNAHPNNQTGMLQKEKSS
ncbi:MAG: hypothetical protein KDD53_10730 [Bdellovibrionales bacterium]|nr:hypothetical protein [Bdellovibrionales bacterium]